MALNIIKLYGNVTEHFQPEDMYDSRQECISDHPNDEVMEGWGVQDTETGFLEADSEDWYDTEEDAQAYIDSLNK